MLSTRLLARLIKEGRNRLWKVEIKLVKNYRRNKLVRIVLGKDFRPGL
jgi:hypothetical protein